MGELDDIIVTVNKRYQDADGKPAPVWANKLNYESVADNLQPVYFWITDFSKNFFKQIEKTRDSFVTSPGSSYFSELGTRATRMQEESIKILGYVNTLIKSILNLIYDLKEWDLRLKDYDNFNSTDSKKKEIGILALKQGWMSAVDAKRGMGSIDNMAHQYGFTLLRPAFIAANSVEEAEKQDINDMVKRIIKPRIAEFFEWAKLSEEELRKRYKIEQSYLKNQINTLKLYTAWVKPYLEAAKQLGMQPMGTNPALVSAFSTMVLELEILATKEFKVDEAVVAKELPKNFKRLDEKRRIRKFYSVGIINFTFRTFPSQGAMHSGKVEVDFKAYALNKDELDYFTHLRKEKEMNDLFAVTSITEEALETLKDDIEKYTKDEEKKPEKEAGMFAGILKDFQATIGLKKQPKKDSEEDKAKKEEEQKQRIAYFKENGIPKDSFEEAVVRPLAEFSAAEGCFKIYDVFKKSRGMASFPSPLDEPDIMKSLRAKMAEAKNLRIAKEAQEAREAGK